MSPPEDRPGLTSSRRVPYGLMSLLEMHNFSLWAVCALRTSLFGEHLTHSFTPKPELGSTDRLSGG